MDGRNHKQQASSLGRALACCPSGCMLPVYRFGLAVTFSLANRRFMFSFATVSVLAAKLVHIYAHRSALPTVDIIRWGCSFFAQDIVLLMAVHLLLTGCTLTASASLRFLARAVVGVVMAYIIVLSLINVSFFASTGSEIHWRNADFAGHAASRALLLTGITSLLMILFVFLLIAWILQGLPYALTSQAIDIIRVPFSCSWMLWLRLANYSQLPQQDTEAVKDVDNAGRKLRARLRANMRMRLWPAIWRVLLYAFVGIALVAQTVLLILRPHESSITFMSWTPALLPFVDFKSSSPNLDKILPVYGSGIGHDWDNRSALIEPKPLSWLPEGFVLSGFEDWNEGKRHYSAVSDPLKISNLDDDILEELRDILGDVPIRHVMLVILESTRKDVFPIKKEGLIWKRFQESFANKSLPETAQRRLATLSQTANYLTGDYDDGFPRAAKDKKGRGGINFNNAYTTSTYTIKSMAGILCGIMPLVADFNLEYDHHIYQPCLPQILNAFNTLDDTSKDEYTTYKWRSTYLTSVILCYDKLELLLASMGYPQENLIGKEYLKGPFAKLGPVEYPDINYFGMAETCLEDYISDAFASAKEKDERLFLTHLTSTSHHPFTMPSDENYVPLGNGLDDLSHYVNAIGYDDRWLRRVLHMLDKQGVANETLVVAVGDHGLSIPEDGKLPTYYNPKSANNHVPLVFSHPKLPSVTVNTSVSSLQVLPTILDLLRETGSLSKMASKAAAELMSNYEGQSLVRPMRNGNNSSGKTGVGDWQFTLVNPGSAMVSVRDARSVYSSWRLVVPVVDNVEWRFTSLSDDPTEMRPIMGFDFTTFLHNVKKAHGERAAQWAEEGAFVTRWWVEENGKRWRYGPYGDWN